MEDNSRIFNFLKKLDRGLTKLEVIDFQEKFKRIKIDFKDRKFMLVSTLALVFFVSIMAYRGTKAYAIYSGDEKIGLVKTKEEGLEVITKLEKELARKHQASVILKDDLILEECNIVKSKLSKEEELRKNIIEKVDYKVAGYGLFIEDEKVAILKSGKEIDEILDLFKEEYKLEADGDLKSVAVLEELNVRKGTTYLDEIDSKEDVIENIKTGGSKEEIHRVEVGESLYTIAEIYDLDIDNLIEDNKDLDPENLAIGEEVRLVRPDSKLTVVTIEEVEKHEEVAREVEIEYDEDKYEGEEEVREEGKDGQVKKILEIKKHNGEIIEEEILLEEVIEEPEKKILVKGKKEKPSYIATGTFLIPTRGYVSSPYGPRWGRMHRGIDIAAGHGSPIQAADGGTVVYADWDGSYGKLVEIDHGNGYRTKYAHCSSIDVSVGQKVAKGENIAAVGSTGRSTGAHLHLEVIKNGTHQNPANYLY